MKHHARTRAALSLATLWVVVAACDVATEGEPSAGVEAQAAVNVVAKTDAVLEAETKTEVDVVIEPTAFDLEAVAKVVEAGEIASAAELEVIVNDDERGYNHIDIDGDGTIDHVQVVELEAKANVAVDADVVLELRAVPSSTRSAEAAITFATVSFAQRPVHSEVEIRASYTAVVHEPKVRVYTHVVPVKIEAGVLVGGSVFLSWVYAVERPAYVGVFVVDERGHWIPPGHVKHGHWKATGHADDHGRHEAKGGARADGRFVVDARGGSRGSVEIYFGAHGSSAKGGKTKSSSAKSGAAKGASAKGGKSKGGSAKGSAPKGGKSKGK